MPLVCPGHVKGVVGLRYSPPTADGVFLISACLDQKPMLRDAATGDWIGTFFGHKGAVWSACLDRQATRAATGAADLTARIWNALTGEALHTFEHRHIVKTVDFSTDGGRLATGGQMKTLQVYDTDRAEAPPMELGGESCHAGGCRVARFVAGHASLLVSGGPAEPELLLWDLRVPDTRQPVRTVSIGGADDGVLYGERCSDDDGVLSIVTRAGQRVQVWNVVRLECVREWAVPPGSESVALQPANHTSTAARIAVVTNSRDNTVRIYDYHSGAERECLRGHHGPVWVAAFHPDGQSFATGSDDSSIRIWQTQPQANAHAGHAVEDKAVLNADAEGGGRWNGAGAEMPSAGDARGRATFNHHAR